MVLIKPTASTQSVTTTVKQWFTGRTNVYMELNYVGYLMFIDNNITNPSVYTSQPHLTSELQIAVDEAGKIHQLKSLEAKYQACKHSV